MNQLPSNLNYVVANAYAPSAPEVFKPRAPTSTDTQYAIQQRWFNTATNQEYLLIGFTSIGGLLQAVWKNISSGSNILEVAVPHGISPIQPDVTGTVTFTSNDATVTITGSSASPNNNFIDFSAAAGASGIQHIITDTGAGTPLQGATINLNSTTPFNTSTGPNAISVNAIDNTHGVISLQLAGSNATSSTPNNFGIAQFDANQFTVSSGFVQLKGATGNPAIQDVDLDNATTPIFAASNGHISLKGGTIQNTGTSSTAVQTSGSSSNDAKINLQFAGSNASVSTPNNFGISQYDSNQFTVSSGFVRLKGGTTPAILNIPVPNGTSPVVPSATGAISLTSSGGTLTITGGTNTINLDIAGGGVPLDTLSDDIGTTITPSANNIQLVGHIKEQGSTVFSTVVAGTHLANINPMSSSRWIVDPLGFNGTHTTIASAITSANSGDTIFLLPGTYTENLTLKAGVNLAAYECDSTTPNVTILGKCTFTGAGTVSISGIQLKTNGDFCLAVTGSSNSVVYILNCFINCNDHTAISLTSSSANSIIRMKSCQGDVATTGITYFSHSGAGILEIANTSLGNTGASTTNSTISGTGELVFYFSRIIIPITTSSSGIIQAQNSLFDAGTNNIAITHNGSSTNCILSNCEINGGTASAVSIGTGSVLTLSLCSVNSTNTNAITGSGTLVNSGITFPNTSSLINTTTVTARNFDVGGISFDGGNNILSNYAVGTWTATWTGATTAGTTNYSNQNGYYVRTGSAVQCQFCLVVNSASGTGDIKIGGLPFTIKNQTRGDIVGSIWLNNAITWPTSRTFISLYSAANSTSLVIACSGTGQNGANMQLSNNGQTAVGNLTYEI